ncbi:MULTISPECIES: acyltransferase family protein [Streptomyces]|uniref:Peptidoglycan/LPS O-acetylase OafA/YrhL n=1 Tax=Streptomyces clavifer TaxID=68188 RepID=A0ABS4V6F1_9ACTN|nr:MULTISPECIES: acyltransferase [Streptomyces]KQX81438.1 acyltransferase [Streptomyces sp. Root1319]KQZ04161.1 acyltransferase [Streptomyces sp. Root55]MBP2359482.1 peptidoglycan/LPS O-acetylase OafA/YrhL [Streptomyces clavifer]MDX2744967.1 acyltransferase [Streptomyces sp. NRRL_B-2557]RPK80316.1 Acyltransferase family protein [Streptomyces sp. ADI97-07]
MTITPQDAGRTGAGPSTATAPPGTGFAEEARVPAPPLPGDGSGASSPPAPRHSRMRALDGLRLLAALMVAAYHYGGRGGDITAAWGSSPAVQFPTAHTWFAYGPLGVQIFFVISGFVICMSGWGRSLSSFFASRVARLMPAYWAAVVLVTLVFALPVVAYEAVSPSDALVNLTLLQQPLGADRVLGVCWTLWAEIRFYALFALFVVLPGANRRRIVLFCAVWTLAAALTKASGEPFLDVLLMPEHAPFFVGGIGLYLVHRDRRDAVAWGIVGVSWLLGQHHAVADLWHPAGQDAFSYRSSAVIILIVTAGFAVVAAIALGALHRVDWPWLTVAGALTYPFYLVHEHLGWVVVGVLHRTLGVPAALTAVLTVGAMLALAWLLHRYVERWSTPLLRKALTPSAAPRRTAP